jgi:tRNA nucleotidyltransferase (CCA-adding enzyme)
MIGDPFKQAVPVLQLIENAGFEAYFVGGSVRDHILGRDISDVDIATSALPQELKGIFPKTNDVGIEHGTILVHHNGGHYEITTFRSEENYSDFRRPDKVSFIRSLKEDLQRRDFTMNAMAMDKDGNIIDPFKGKEAIKNKQIATVGNPDERFGEDALRMLRAVRFQSQLSFAIEKGTLKSLVAQCHLLENIAVERKTVEFEKLLMGTGRREAVHMLADSGIINYLPGLKGHADAVKRFSSRLTENFQLIESWVLLVFEFGLKEKKIEDFLREWKLPVNKIKRINRVHSLLLSRLEKDWDLERVYYAGLEDAISAELVYSSLQKIGCSTDKIEELHDQLPIKHRRELKVTGNDVMSWMDKPPGPWLRLILEGIERSVINNDVPNEKEKIKKWLSAFNQKSEEN